MHRLEDISRKENGSIGSYQEFKNAPASHGLNKKKKKSNHRVILVDFPRSKNHQHTRAMGNFEGWNPQLSATAEGGREVFGAFLDWAD